MPPPYRLGDKVPTSVLAATLTAAMRSAETGHCTFDEVSLFEIDFTIYPDRTDARVRDAYEDLEWRVVGDTKYELDRRRRTTPDGNELSVETWVTTDLNSTRWEDRLLVPLERASTYYCTPLGLVEGLVGDGDATVVESNETSTTFECRMFSAAWQRAEGENPLPDDGWDTGDDHMEVRVVVDAEGLPTRFEVVGDEDLPFTFSGWGSTPRVAPPDAPTVDAGAFYTSLNTPYTCD